MAGLSGRLEGALRGGATGDRPGRGCGTRQRSKGPRGPAAGILAVALGHREPKTVERRRGPGPGVSRRADEVCRVRRAGCWHSPRLEGSCQRASRVGEPSARSSRENAAHVRVPGARAKLECRCCRRRAGVCVCLNPCDTLHILGKTALRLCPPCRRTRTSSNRSGQERTGRFPSRAVRTPPPRTSSPLRCPSTSPFSALFPTPLCPLRTGSQACQLLAKQGQRPKKAPRA